ncbi:MAG: penicillin acylase family protein, partial [Anaerolineales bacterium]
GLNDVGDLKLPVVGPEYPYSISRQWSYGYRAQSIVDMLENAPGPIDIPYLRKMQGDNRDINAEQLVPILLEVPLSNGRLTEARDLLAGWDYQAQMDSAPAALFEVFWKNLLDMTFRDDLPEFFWPGGGSAWFEILRYMVDDPTTWAGRPHPWWDDQNTPEVEDRDLMFARAFEAAVDELEKTLGKNPNDWAWGDLHTITFEHAVMSNFPLIGNLFNEGPFRTSGGSGIVNATGWSAEDDENTYIVDWVPSMRMIVDFSNLQNSLAMHTTGQSGHAKHPHYIDMADPWRLIEYHPMLWDRGAVEAAAEAHLRLTP